MIRGSLAYGGGLLLVVSLIAQEPAPISIKVTSPANEMYVSGPMTLRVTVDPAGAVNEVKQVTFFADGKQVCQVDWPPFECNWDAGKSVDEHVIRAVALLQDGRRLPHSLRTKGLTVAENVDVDVVQVTATVTDDQGKFVRGLTSSAFKVFEDDIEQTITYFAAQTIDLEVVVAVDMSGSMARAMPSVKESVKRFLTALRPGDQVTLLAFNDTTFPLARREINPAARLRSIDRLSPWGGTALYDTIIKALDMVGRQQGRRALVVFTDGEDQSSHTTLEAVLRRVEASDATIYMIGQGRGTTIEALKNIQERLARVSGGRAFHTEDPMELDAAFGEILEELSNQYLLVYPPKNRRARDDAWHKIRVELADNRAGQNVRARQGYRASSSNR